MKVLILMIMSTLLGPLSHLAQADDVEPVGACYMDSKCRKPLTDQMVTATQCGRIARMKVYKRAYLLAEFPAGGGRLVGMCGLIYNTIVPPEDPSRVVIPETCPIMFAECR